MNGEELGPNEGAVLRVLERHGECGVGFVAFAAGVSTRTAKYHLRRFVDLGIAAEVFVDPHDVRLGGDTSAFRLHRPLVVAQFDRG